MDYTIDLKLIKEKRLEHGFTLEDMSTKLGFNSKSKYYRRENGEYKFQSEELPKVANILGIPLEKIFVKTYRKSKREVSN